MKTLLYLQGALLLGLLSCEYLKEPPILFIHKISPITISRNTLGKETLPIGSSILFNAQGALNCYDQILIYDGNKWNGQDTLLWEEEFKTTTYTALYPAYKDLYYSLGNLYTDSGLTDILVAKDTLFQKQHFDLSFRHLFSKLTIHVSPDIQKVLTEIHLTVPFSISNISPQSGEFNLIPQTHTTRFIKNETGDYSFIIPPIKESSLTLNLIIDGQAYTCILPSYTFKPSSQYDCSLHYPIKGIRTADDLIAFSRLINKKKYTGEKTLDDFYTVNGKDTIFHLLADIELNAQNSQQLLPIGYHSNYGFHYIFEGNGHTISNLSIPDRSINTTVENQYCGLFGHITPEGVVRNLHLFQARSIDNPNAKQISVLAASNKGLIIHCSVTSSSITYGENTTTLGFICANNSGDIVNCFVKNSTMKAGADSKVGAIAGNAIGHILNCYAYNNTYTPQKTSYTGGIVGMSGTNSSLTIENCCVYHKNIYNNFGAIFGYPRKDSINHVFYNNNNLTHLNSNTYFNDCYKYNNVYQVNDKDLSDLLNEWIMTIGVSQYPQYEFPKWEGSKTLPVFP